MVNSEANNLIYGTGKSISGNYIASETEEYPVTHPEEKGYTKY